MRKHLTRLATITLAVVGTLIPTVILCWAVGGPAVACASAAVLAVALLD